MDSISIKCAVLTCKVDVDRLKNDADVLHDLKTRDRGIAVIGSKWPGA